jgi:restriction system protein
MRTRTIVDAIREVMLAEGRPLSVAEVYDAIVSADLYQFKADKPVHVVQSQLRRHTEGLDFPSAAGIKHFELLQNGKYFLLPQTAKQKRSRTAPAKGLPADGRRGASVLDLKELHQRYAEEFKRRVLERLKKLDPGAFEQFCRNLLVAYGFRDVLVTGKSRDGGIDGHGRLKVGFAYFNVAFQCKRWTRNPVGRPEIQRFRGAIQGQFEQGIFFTTGNFTSDAENSSFKSGAVTVVLINGPTIVDFMIENEFGVDAEHLPVYTLALDEAVTDAV